MICGTLPAEAQEEKVNPTYAEVQEFFGGNGRSQVFKEVKQEWPGRMQKPLGPDLHFAIDGLDWKRHAPKLEQPGHKEQKGYKFILCALDRGTREFFARGLETRSATETVVAMRDILHEAKTVEKP